MATVTVQQAYATVSEAKVYLALEDAWLDLDTKVKEDALLWGRYYIDANFDCIIDADNIPDEVKFANSLLGFDYFNQGDLFFDNRDGVILNRVKAGSVESEKEYERGIRVKPNSISKVTSVLLSVCNRISNKLTRV